MDVNKICRCCLTNDGPLLTIYEGGITNKDCLAAMINKITGIKADPNDKLPDKACHLCIREIKDFYAFRKKCENSHRTLKQLFLCKVEVKLCSPMKYLQTKDSTENKNIIRASKCQMSSVEPVKYTQTKEDNDYSQSVNVETHIESVIPLNNVKKDMDSSPEKRISMPSSQISIQKKCKQTSSSTTKIKENAHTNEFTDSDTDSCDSIEFISDKPKANEPIVVLQEFDETDNDNHNAEVNETAVEYIFKHLSSPQWVPEDEIYLSSVNEDLNFDVQGQSNKCMEDLSNYQNNVNISAGSHYQCAICKQGFKIKIDLIHHLKTHEKPYSCLFCENLFNDYSTLQRHLTEHNTTKSHEPSNILIVGATSLNKPKAKKSKNYACDMCPKRFRVSTSLINHRRIHTGEKPYKCKYCDRAFVQVSTRSNHEKTHTGERRFKCRFCVKTFVQSGSCKTHERTHTGEKPHKCQFCNKGFIQLSCKLRHEETHKKPAVGEHRFKCKYCKRTFVKSENRAAHEMVHTGEKPHKCQYCQRGFITQSVKTRHEATHKRPVIKCPQCDIIFMDSSDVLEHFKIQHT